MKTKEKWLFCIIALCIASMAFGALLSYLHNRHGIFAFLGAEVSLLMGILVLFKGRDRRLSSTFFLMCASISAYSIMLFGQSIVHTRKDAVLFTMITGIGYYFISPTILHFSLEIASLDKMRHRIALVLAYAAAAFFCLAMFAGWFPLEFEPTGYKFSLVLTPWYIAQLTATGITLLYMMVELLLKFLKTPQGLEKTQIGWLLGAFVLTALLAYTNPLAASGLKAYPMGGVALAFLSAVLAYLIVKHRFLDVQLVLRRTFFWTLWTASVAGVYALLLVGLGLFMNVKPLESQLPNLVAILLAAFLILPLRNAVQNLVDRKFFRARYDARKTLEELSAKIVSILDLEQLARETLRTVASTLQAEAAFLFLDERDRGDLALAAEVRAEGPVSFFHEGRRTCRLPKNGWMRSVVQVEPGEAYRNENLTEAVAGFMDPNRVEVALPIGSAEGVRGTLMLAVKRSEMAYTNEDLGLLKTIANQTGVALANARLYEDVLAMKNYNEDILKSMDSGLVTFDRDGRLVSLNRAAGEILGLRDELRGSTLDEIPGTEGPFRESVHDVLAGNQGVSGIEVPLDGKILTLSAAPLRGVKGLSVGALASFVDVTEKVSIQKALERNRRLALLGEMASRVAHEIKNPLASLKLIIAPLDNRLDDAGYRRTLREIVPAEIGRLDRILQGLLDYARPARLIRVPASLESIVRASLEILAPEIEAAGASLDARFEPGLPPALIDGETVKQVVVNLVRNALQAMAGSGTRRLSVSVKSDDEGASLEVADTGEGIPGENLEKLFHPFFSTKAGGSGLGLAVCRKIVEAHGGSLNANSAPGEGAVFRMVVPWAPEEAESPVRDDP